MYANLMEGGLVKTILGMGLHWRMYAVLMEGGRQDRLEIAGLHWHMYANLMEGGLVKTILGMGHQTHGDLRRGRVLGAEKVPGNVHMARETLSKSDYLQQLTGGCAPSLCHTLDDRLECRPCCVTSSSQPPG